MSTRIVVVMVAAGLALAGCGSNGRGSTGRVPASATPVVHRAAALPAGHELARRLDGALRVGLRRFAVASGAAGEYGDIGQSLPTGIVDRVTCDHSSPRQCEVSWQDVLGHAHRTAYVVVGAARGCFDASARPSLPTIYDAVNRSTSQHPLQEISDGAAASC